MDEVDKECLFIMIGVSWLPKKSRTKGRKTVVVVVIVIKVF